MNQGQFYHNSTLIPNCSVPSQVVKQQTPQSARPTPPMPIASIQLTGQTKDLIMVATIHKLLPDSPPRVSIAAHISTLMPLMLDSHVWIINSAASSHLSGNLELFQSLNDSPPVTIETASGDSFTANQRGMIHIAIVSDPSLELLDVPITLTNVIYVLKLKANLLLVGRMTNSNVNMIFRKYSSSLALNGVILTHGLKVDNLFTYVALPIPTDRPETVNFSTEHPDITLWHHRLAHTNYSMLDLMRWLHTVEGFFPKIHHSPISQCPNCLYGEQTHVPFQKTEDCYYILIIIPKIR